MSFFQYYFDSVSFDKEETMVCCPFPHQTVNGLEYYETNPSAGINLGKGLFHCLSCGSSFSEVGFIAKILNCSYETASRLKNYYEDQEDLYYWKENVRLTEEIKQSILDLGISEKVIEELNISSEDGHSISFPVLYFGKILDVRNYRPNQKPKVKSRKDSIAGLILPFDVWKETDPKRWTLLCAGEKDMAVARSHGFNAITLTGGEMAVPINLAQFRGRKVAITYDNDAAGLQGARKVAAYLRDYAEEVRVVTGFHQVCSEQGEDITDFFMKYKGTRGQLIDYINSTEPFSNDDYEEEIEKLTPTVSLMEATLPQNINRTLRSNVQIVATLEDIFPTPTSVEAHKFAGDDKATMGVGEKRYWYLDETNLKDILHLVDNRFKESDIRDNIRRLMKLPPGEKNVSVKTLSKETVFRCAVTDLFETKSDATASVEFNAYTIGKKLESGKKYRVTYKLVPHPYNGQKLTMIITKVDEANDSVTNFKITEENKKNLDVVKNMEGTVAERIDILTNQIRGLTKFDTEATLVQAIDFSYNTVLQFNFRNFKNVRGYLDTLIVTESRVGKSSTAEALQEAYGLGVFTSLAGSSATVAGIIGGSNKVSGSFQTRAGLIPQNHKGLIVFEELAKCNSLILREMTDVKSSGRVRITRVNGTLDLPALVRMIYLTNTKTRPGEPTRPITSYPNGIEVVTDLINTAEDIARFDIILVQAFRGGSMDADWEMPTPLPYDVYRTRIRWIWSRTVNQIKISDEIEHYIIDQCNKLNAEYDSHIKIFGTEAWKKLTRLAIAIAGVVVSTDETYENIVVLQEHVDYAVEFYKRIYDNDTFRLKEYVMAERRYEEVDDEAVTALQQTYITHAALLLQLEGASACTRAELQAATGLDNQLFAAQLNILVQQAFIRFQGTMILPTLRFRKAMKQINRNTGVFRTGGVKSGVKI